MTDFRDQFWRPSSAEERAEEAARRYEHSSVAYLIDKVFGKKELKAALGRAQDELGIANLSFLMFRTWYPAFPIYLGLHYRADIHKLASCSQVALFRQFRASPFADAYLQHREEARQDPISEGRPIGVIVPRLGLQRGLVVYEDCAYPASGMRFIYCSTWSGREIRLVIEPFQALVKALSSAVGRS